MRGRRKREKDRERERERERDKERKKQRVGKEGFGKEGIGEGRFGDRDLGQGWLGGESHGRERAREMRAWGGRTCTGMHAGGGLKAGGEGLRCAEEGLEWMACRGMPGGEA